MEFVRLLLNLDNSQFDLTYNKQKRKPGCKLYICEYFFFESNFCAITAHFFNPILKMFCNILLRLNMANAILFLALSILKRSKIKLGKMNIRFDQQLSKMIQAGREEFDNSFNFKILGVVWQPALQALLDLGAQVSTA